MVVVVELVWLLVSWSRRRVLLVVELKTQKSKENVEQNEQSYLRENDDLMKLEELLLRD